MRLQLADQIHIRGDHRTQHEVSAARDRVAVQNDRLAAAGNLNRPVRIACVDNVRRIGTRAERRRARLEFERTPAAEAIADAIRFRRYLPRIREKIPTGLLCDAMPVKACQYAQFDRGAGYPPQIGGDGAALLDGG